MKRQVFCVSTQNPASLGVSSNMIGLEHSLPFLGHQGTKSLNSPPLRSPYLPVAKF